MDLVDQLTTQHNARTIRIGTETTLSLVAAIMAVAITALAYYTSTGLGGFWPAAWLAPIPILMLAFRSSTVTATLASLTAYVCGGMNLPYTDWGVSRSTLVLTLLALYGIPFAASVLSARFAVRRLPPMAALFVFPTFWTAYEFLYSRAQPNGTIFNLAYSQINVLPLAQIASIAGMWGITFVITLIPSAVAVAWERRASSVLIILRNCRRLLRPIPLEKPRPEASD